MTLCDKSGCQKSAKYLCLVALTFFMVVPLYSPASAQQDSRDLSNRLDRLDNEIQTLSQAVFKGGIIPKKSAEDYKSQTRQINRTPADVEVRLSQLEREIRALTGRVETQAHEISKVENDLKRRMSDLEMRIRDLERGGAPRSSSAQTSSSDIRQTPPATTSQQPTNITRGEQGGQGTELDESVSGTLGSLTNSRQLPIDMYETAFAKLKNGQYEDAEKAFRSFISQNPDHRLVSNARYWLGETFYVREDYEQAARAFARGYKENPSGAKAPDNLLKLGLSLDGLGNREDACVALIQLNQKFPDGPRPVLNRAAQEIERLDCSR